MSGRIAAASASALLLAAACATTQPADDPPVSVVAIASSTAAPKPAPPPPVLPPPPPPPPPAPAPPPAPPPVLPAVPEAGDPLAADRAAFERSCAELEALAKKRRLAGARGRLPELLASAERLGAPERLRARTLAFEAYAAARAWDEAEAAGLGWRLACGPGDDAACRKKSLAALDRLAKDRPELRAKVAALRAGDRCAARLPRAGKAPPPCVAAAAEAAATNADRLLAADLALGEAKRLARRDRAAGLAALDEVDRACPDERCLGVRRKALRARHDLAGADVAAAAEAALRDLALSLAEERPADPVHHRTALVARACARLDAEAGVGACRALERKANGHFTFRDFSTRKGGKALALSVVQEVAREYAPLLEACLAREAERLAPPATESLSLAWTVAPDGRVDDVRSTSGDDAFLACARAQFAHWRYPRPSRPQSLEQSFTVQAGARP